MCFLLASLISSEVSSYLENCPRYWSCLEVLFGEQTQNCYHYHNYWFSFVQVLASHSRTQNPNRCLNWSKMTALPRPRTLDLKVEIFNHISTFLQSTTRFLLFQHLAATFFELKEKKMHSRDERFWNDGADKNVFFDSNGSIIQSFYAIIIQHPNGFLSDR